MLPNEVIETVLELWKHSSDHIPMLEASPGVGKSEIVAQIADALGVAAEHRGLIIASQRDQFELAGIPDVGGSDQFVNYKMLDFWRPVLDDGKPGARILFLDELSDGGDGILNGLSNVLTTRSIDRYRLHPECFIIAAGNRKEHRSGARRLPTKLANRVCRIAVDVDSAQWIRDYARPNGISERIISYLQLRPSNLNTFEPTAEAFATPRQWARVNKIPESIPAAIRSELYAGYLGEDVGHDFAAFLKLEDKLPKMSEIKADPLNAKLPENSAEIYAVVGMIVGSVRDESDLSIAWQYVKRITADYWKVFQIGIEQRGRAQVVANNTWIRICSEIQRGY